MTPVTRVFEVPVYSDPEITAMGALLVVLSGLNDAAKYRVLRWAVRKMKDAKISSPSDPA